MSTIVVDRQSVRMPNAVLDLEAFRQWARSEAFPDAGRICYLNGEVWVDMSKEQFTHNQINGEVTAVLTRLAKRSRGRFLPDGYLLTNPQANLSTNPDGIYVSEQCLRTREVQFVEGADEGLVELEGAPDMVLEIVSPSSVEKDTITLFELYARAGIREYWLINPLGERLAFSIFRHTSKGYVRRPKEGGWCRSTVLRKQFRLTQRVDSLGYPEFTLSVR
jgi:Uma2 family endonuclease